MTDRDELDIRPSADAMLARIRGDESASGGRGRLRIYLGMAPGVGKTYRMLEEAHRRVDRGTDLAVGYVESHGRPLTAALLDGLEVVPRARVEHRGVVIEEMDTEAVIARRPTVAIVDELAHTNVPGSPREKRWEDVELIRDAGIHVISTCNVQHLESVADAVATITGAPVNERLPDAVLAAADEVELVDMSPRALRQRMKHGNVYPPERAAIALERFFSEGNLTALRELALRFTARRVDEQLGVIATDAGARAGGKFDLVAERTLVVIDGSPGARLALRRGASLASALRGPLVGLVVETPSAGAASFDAARDLRENLDYATDLGAELVRVEAPDQATGVVEAVRTRRATRVVLAATPAPRGLARLGRRTLLEELLERLPGIELHVVPAEEAPRR
jgi:two-component system, OmpR family, sensor histidine kinase KdpD